MADLRSDARERRADGQLLPTVVNGRAPVQAISWG
jgi:hypothetical protein